MPAMPAPEPVGEYVMLIPSAFPTSGMHFEISGKGNVAPVPTSCVSFVEEGAEALGLQRPETLLHHLGVPRVDAAAMLWRHTDLTPSDVDVAQLYDGFSFMALAFHLPAVLLQRWSWRIELRIHPGPAWSDDIRSQLGREAREAFGVPIEISTVERFERRGRGKHRDFVRAEDLER